MRYKIAGAKVLGEKIERSVASFSGELTKKEAEYLFVLEDLEQEQIVGSSLILAKHGSQDVPHYYFKLIKSARYERLNERAANPSHYVV